MYSCRIGLLASMSKYSAREKMSRLSAAAPYLVIGSETPISQSSAPASQSSSRRRSLRERLLTASSISAMLFIQDTSLRQRRRGDESTRKSAVQKLNSLCVRAEIQHLSCGVMTPAEACL